MASKRSQKDISQKFERSSTAGGEYGEAILILTEEMARRRRVAIIGSGCAGLGAAWALKDTNYDVHIFEKESRLGGHTNTQTFKSRDGSSVAVDTGFIVMNSATYPNFIRFLQKVCIHLCLPRGFDVEDATVHALVVKWRSCSAGMFFLKLRNLAHALFFFL